MVASRRQAATSMIANLLQLRPVFIIAVAAER
jgi:hypothetical protein